MKNKFSLSSASRKEKSKSHLANFKLKNCLANQKLSKLSVSRSHVESKGGEERWKHCEYHNKKLYFNDLFVHNFRLKKNEILKQTKIKV